MTVVFPPLIKPDGRFSRIRLSGFLCRRAESNRFRGHWVESIGREERAVRPAFVFPRAIAVFAP